MCTVHHNFARPSSIQVHMYRCTVLPVPGTTTNSKSVYPILLSFYPSFYHQVRSLMNLVVSQVLLFLCFDASLLFDLRRWWVLYSLPCMLDTHCGDVFFSFQFHPIQQNHAHRRHLFFEGTNQFNWSIGACVVLMGFRNVIGFFFFGVTSSLLLPVKFWYYR